MKKNLLFLLPILLITSCNKNDNPTTSNNIPAYSDNTGVVYFYKSKIDTSSYFKEVNKSQTDETKCYLMSLYIDIDAHSSYKVNKKDFKLSFDTKDYSCLSIVNSYKEEVNDGETVKKYITSSLDEKEFTKDETDFQLFYVAFESRPTNEEFKLTYKGTEINKDIPGA